MALIEKGINVRVIDKRMREEVYAVQADTGRSVRCVIVDWTIPDDATATVYVMKPSKAICYNTATVDTSTNSVLVELTNQMLAEQGLSVAMVEITSGGEVVTAFNFKLTVDYKIAGGVESSNESTVLQAMLDDLAAAVNEAIANAETATDSANTATDNANDAADAANEAAQSVEDAKTAATEAAEAANTAATAANEAAESATEAAASANEAAESANSAATTANEAAESTLESMAAFNELGLSIVDGLLCQTYESEDE